MNRTLTSLVLTAATITATFGVTSLKAQDHLAYAEIPFAFHAQSQVMPAGRYAVSQATSTSMFVVAIRDPKGHASFLTGTPGSDSNPSDPKLTFSVHNGEYTLQKVDLPGSTTSRNVNQSKSSYKVALEPLVVVRLSH